MSEIEDAMVGFSLSGEGLDPHQVTALLGITPSRIHSRGDLVSARVQPATYHRAGLWSLDADTPGHLPVPEQLRSLLQKLVPVADRIRSLSRAGITAEVRCGIFPSRPQAGTTLSPDIMRGIAELDASFGLTIYSEDGTEG